MPDKCVECTSGMQGWMEVGPKMQGKAGECQVNV